MDISKLSHKEKCALLAKLMAIPSHTLSDEDLEIKGKLIGEIDIVNDPEMEKYVSFPTHGWFVGKVEGQYFIPMDRGVRIPIPERLRLPDGDATEEWYKAHIAVFKDGYPKNDADSMIEIVAVDGV